MNTLKKLKILKRLKENIEDTKNNLEKCNRYSDCFDATFKLRVDRKYDECLKAIAKLEEIVCEDEKQGVENV